MERPGLGRSGKITSWEGEKTAARQSLSQAIAALQNFRGSDSRKADIQRPIVELAAQLGDVGTAQAQYQQMFINGVRRGSIPYNKYKAVPALAFALTLNGRLDQANKVVLEIPTTHLPFRVEAYARMAGALKQHGRLNEAAQCAEKAWQTAGRILGASEKSEAWPQVGEAFGLLGYRKRARLAYRQAVSDLSSVQERTSWNRYDNGKTSSGVYTEMKPRLAMQVLESQARTGDTGEAAKLLSRISAPDEVSLKEYVYSYQAKAWLALARSYVVQGRLEEAASALKNSQNAVSKAEHCDLETALMQMQIALHCSQEETDLAAQAAQKCAPEVREWPYRHANAIRERAAAALLLIKSAQPQVPQPKPLSARCRRTGFRKGCGHNWQNGSACSFRSRPRNTFGMPGNSSGEL